MTLLDFAKLAVRKRRAVAAASGSPHRQVAVTSQLPSGAKKEDTQDKYNDYENGPQPQVSGGQTSPSFSGGATS